MDFKTFFIKEVVMTFFVSVTCISAGMAVIGMIYEPEVLFNFKGLLYPHIYGAVASLLMLVKYSKKELSTRQMAFRSIIHFILLEVTIMLFFYFGNPYINASILTGVALSVLIIYIAVNLIFWINDRNTAKMFNAELKKMQNGN